MRKVITLENGRRVAVYDCAFCEDRGKVTVPGPGISWDRESGYFDPAGCFSVWCPICRGEEFASRTYRAETYHFLADWGSIQGGETRPLTQDMRSRIAEMVCRFMLRENEPAWYVEA